MMADFDNCVLADGLTASTAGRTAQQTPPSRSGLTRPLSSRAPPLSHRSGAIKSPQRLHPSNNSNPQEEDVTGKKSTSNGEADNDDDEGPRLPCCWCFRCACVRCRGICLCEPNKVPFIIRLFDCFLVFLYWLAGMYQPGGTFKRSVWQFFENRIKVRPGISCHGVRSVDISFPSSFTPGLDLKVRVYEPITLDEENDPETTPHSNRAILLYLHGGGMVMGDVAVKPIHELCCKLSNRGGYVVVSLNYRKAPEFRFPTQVYDAYDCLRWLCTKPVDGFPVRNVDFSKIVLVGESSGGNLALVVSTLVRDGLGPDLQPKRTQDPRMDVRGLVLLYPVLFADSFVQQKHKAKPIDLPIIPRPTLDFFGQAYAPENTRESVSQTAQHDRRMCPLLAGLHGLPHTVLISVGKDYLHHEHLIALQELIRMDVPLNYHYYEFQCHGFLNLGKLAGEKCDAAIKAIIDDLKNYVLHSNNIKMPADVEEEPHVVTLSSDVSEEKEHHSTHLSSRTVAGGPSTSSLHDLIRMGSFAESR